jgi:hypothetical protein
LYPDPLSLSAMSLLAIGESFYSEHPKLAQRAPIAHDAIERQGVRGYGRDQGISIETCLQGLIDRLALRFLTAVRM